MDSAGHKGWHGRGYLPHFDQPGRVQHVVFRLHESLPRAVMEGLKRPVFTSEARRLEVDAVLDRGLGPRWLADDRVARIVVDALLFFDGERYRLLAWCVMSNHVHVVVEQVDGWPLGGVVASWKTHSARSANRMLARSGPLWAKDYFDRYVRDETGLLDVIDYVEGNPVKAGLCKSPEDWPWSSASVDRAHFARNSGSDCG